VNSIEHIYFDSPIKYQLTTVSRKHLESNNVIHKYAINGFNTIVIQKNCLNVNVFAKYWLITDDTD